MPDALAGHEYQTPKSKEVSLAGCLVQGSGPSVFILENVTADPRDSAEKGQNYLLTSGSMSISFSQRLNSSPARSGPNESHGVALPVCFPHGVHDCTCTYAEASTYFERLAAPLKGGTRARARAPRGGSASKNGLQYGQGQCCRHARRFAFSGPWSWSR